MSTAATADGPQGPPRTRDGYGYFLDIPTRWKDNDQFGHINNVNYYSFIDTVINTYLIKYGGFDPLNSDTVGFCVESSCKYFSPLAYPQTLSAGLRVKKLGNSSAVYEVAIFGSDTATDAAATGHFVHVFVDSETQKPSRIPNTLRNALERLAVTDQMPASKL
eukprot:CAMPEP_0119518266 /NCGR_PEP_ID=MMETSP1344-20130328/34923_1 /TAXON_ID=236787 /ORGANISM="Florenciella parvula, Strain CCMP2471" /LENGTH=162 /DNA_ID=CAMNT_0007555935 /DNA_START=57 /DNA_END=545 /DNA_ORIENTATION=+